MCLKCYLRLASAQFKGGDNTVHIDWIFVKKGLTLNKKLHKKSENLVPDKPTWTTQANLG